MTKVLVMAGGKSSRLTPLSNKILFRFCGKTLFEHQIALLHTAGFHEFFIVGNSENLEILQQISQNLSGTFQFLEQTNLEEGMAGNILTAKKMLQNEPVLVLSSNDLFDISLFQMMKEQIEKKEADILLTGKKVSSYFPGGYFSFKNDQITHITEKPGEGNKPSDFVNIVFHYFQNFSQFTNALEQTKAPPESHYEEALNTLLQQGVRVQTLKYEGTWNAIKYPWDILDMQQMFFDQQTPFIHPSAEIAKSALIKGNVVIKEGVKILDNAVISGPAFIDTNSLIATNALVRESSIGRNSVVGFSTEIARSYLFDSVWTHTNYIGDSIIDSDVSFGSGTVTGNLRFDEQEILGTVKQEKIKSGKTKLGACIGSGVRTGINVSFSPGISIGKNSWISPGIIVEKSIPEESFVKNSAKIEIVPNSRIVKKERNIKDLLRNY